MVEVRYRDRLGNNLFQYALGRLIAEELGFALQATPLEGFPGTSDPVRGTECSGPVEELGGHRVDLATIFSNRSPRRIVLDGWFQRVEYFTPYRSRIQQWFRLAPEHHTRCDADLVVHVRRTDYVGIGLALPFSYYREAIERALPKGGRLIIATDDPTDTFFRRFRRWRPTYFRGTPLRELSCMINAPRLVMSASTFSWWPTFLGNPELVVCPVPSFGIWAPGGEHQIDLIEHERFLCLPCPMPYTPNAAERLRQRAIKWVRRRFGVDVA